VANRQRVAVLGAGMQGTCVALELAARGCAVDLYDRAEAPLTGAAVVNEGKIHLGFIYALDPTLATARRMLAGALHVASSLRRWIPYSPELAGVTGPCHYAVTADSMVPAEGLRAYYQAVAGLYREARNGSRRGYLETDGDGASLVRELSPAEREPLFDATRVTTAFATAERSVDPVRVAGLLRQALAASPEVRFLGGVHVVGAQPSRRGVEVTCRRGDLLASERYDQVVNALWTGRLPVDASAGIPTRRSWIFRYRVGFRVRIQPGTPAIPTINFVHGPYGDAVSYPGGEVYLSWYPICRLVAAPGLEPTPGWSEPAATTDRLQATLRHLGDLSPTLARLANADFADVAVLGGWVMAPGEDDIDQRGSKLHRRDNPGVRSRGPYHSVDTGKYTMAPYLAVRTADRLLRTARRGAVLQSRA
jgi:glycine/D-amino acid oxidase-like deaminating enzyme